MNERLLTPNDMKDAMRIPIKNSLSFEAEQVDFERLVKAQDSKSYPEGKKDGAREVIKEIEERMVTRLLGDFPISYSIGAPIWQALKEKYG